jgi:hypothetical protein
MMQPLIKIISIFLKSAFYLSLSRIAGKKRSILKVCTQHRQLFNAEIGKKAKLRKHAIILFSLSVTSLYAYNDLSHVDPLNQPLSEAFIDPFAMTAFSIGKLYPRHHRNIKDTFKDTKWFNNLVNHTYELKLELPFQEANVSAGFDATLFCNEIASGDTDSQFNAIYAFEMLATFKLKFPFYNKLGSFAFTMTPKIGLIYINAAQSSSRLPPLHGKFGGSSSRVHWG